MAEELSQRRVLLVAGISPEAAQRYTWRKSSIQNVVRIIRLWQKRPKLMASICFYQQPAAHVALIH